MLAAQALSLAVYCQKLHLSVPSQGRGCKMTFQRKTKPIADRLWPKVVWQSNGCWNWTGKVSVRGYGTIRIKKGSKWGQGYAHKIAYELVRGIVPNGLEIDHLCKNKVCCNPSHLEAVTHLVNSRRAMVKSHCKHGHEFNEDNTYITREGWKMCKKCNAERQRRYSLNRAIKCS